MQAVTKHSYCKQLRQRFLTFLAEKFSLDKPWMQNHLAHCPKCRARFASLARVELALSLLKSQPHNLNLLMRANTQAIGVLKHSLRQSPKADHLRSAKPDLNICEKCTRFKHALTNAAACLLIAFLVKSGAYSSTRKFEDQSRRAVHQYYARQAGDDLAADVFSTHA
jgi:hypothetical protein